jgi:hypothetical protein
MAATKKNKKREEAISQAYRKHGDRVQVRLMDLPRIMNAAGTAYDAGKDYEAVMIEQIKIYRQN